MFPTSLLDFGRALCSAFFLGRSKLRADAGWTNQKMSHQITRLMRVFVSLFEHLHDFQHDGFQLSPPRGRRIPQLPLFPLPCLTYEVRNGPGGQCKNLRLLTI